MERSQCNSQRERKMHTPMTSQIQPQKPKPTKTRTRNHRNFPHYAGLGASTNQSID